MTSALKRTAKARTALLAGFASIAFLGLVLAQGAAQGEKDAKGAAKVNHFIGADKCKNCHAAEEKGNQYGSWLKTKHATAFAGLATDAAKKIATEKGIADAQKSDVCLKCHSTAFGEPEDHIKKGFDPKAGVQCESCHGPGETHMKARMAEAAKADPANKEPQVVPAGEILTNIDQKTCLVCHNDQSPSFKPFCFTKAVAANWHFDPRKKPVVAPPVCGCGDACPCVHGCEDGKCAGPKK
jgi:hypothetical protein